MHPQQVVVISRSKCCLGGGQYSFNVRTKSYSYASNHILLLQERLAKMEQEVNEEEQKQKSEIMHKKEQIDLAERKKNETVSDSKLVRNAVVCRQSAVFIIDSVT